MVDRHVLTTRYRLNRNRSWDLFDVLVDDVYYRKPIGLRHPIVFYEGHLPGFSFNTLVKKALGGASIDSRLETLFARGIDPEGHVSLDPAGVPDPGTWPSREVVRRFAEEADARVIDALEHADIDAAPERREAAFAILEHEVMHQETVLYMWHRLPFSQKRRPKDYQPRTDGAVPPIDWIEVPAGCATLGVDRGSHEFGWDNEFGACALNVPAFAIERHNITNARYLEFVDAGGYQDARWWISEDWQWVENERVEHPLFWERHDASWYWRGMFDQIPLPPSWPVYVSHAEAAAYARWRGARLPTEAEYQRAAFGSPDGERLRPWGSDEPVIARGVFDFSSWDPEPAGSHPRGASAWGIEDLVGNGWEWTSTTFGPFAGFRPMTSYPQYSADFFDGRHMVMKGASPATAVELLRPTFRNWFRTQYPFVYATFRCVRDASR